MKQPPNRPPQNVISQEQALQVLTPHLNTLRECIEKAWNIWEQIDPAFRRPLSAFARARIIYDHIVAEAEARFSGTPGIKIVKHMNLITIQFHTNPPLVLRFKKLDDRYRSRNYPTKQQQLFQLQASLPGLPEAARLIAGYQLNGLQTGIRAICVTMPIGNRVEWAFEIEGQLAILEPFPTAPLTLPRPKVRPKNIQKREDNEPTV